MWNWNVNKVSDPEFYEACLNRTSVELKRDKVRSLEIYTQMFESNQCGIETSRKWSERNSIRYCLNRTSVELKLDILTRYRSYTLFVWIEPVWNWDNRMVSTGSQTDWVWIEPVWNWNMKVLRVSPSMSKVWIEPVWNWDFRKPHRSCCEPFLFESNQCGIET